MGESSLARTAGRGAAFTIGSQLARLILQLTSVVVLSRLLTPSDYGVVAVVLVVVAFGETFRDLGLSSASIQATVLTPDQRGNLFWVNVAVGASLAVGIVLLAEPIAATVGTTEVADAARALSMTFVLNGATAQYRAGLLRSLRFRTVAVIDVVAAALALGVAVGMGIAGADFWALVVQQLTLGSITLLATVAVAGWWPVLPNRRGNIRSLLRFGWSLVGSQLVAYASANIDSLLVGLRFGTAPLGFYNRAFQLVMTPVNQIRGPVTTVAVPVLSRIKDSHERFNEYVAVGQLGLGYPLCLALGAAAVLADPITAVALGPQWGPTGPLLRLLAISAIFQTLAFVGYWVYVSRGLGAALFRFSLVSAGVRVTAIAIGSNFGVTGVAVGFMIGPAINWPLSIGWLSRVTVVPTRRLYAGAARILCLVAAASGISAIVAFALIPPVPPSPTLLIGLVSYALVVSAALLLPWYRADAAMIVRVVAIARGKTSP